MNIPQPLPWRFPQRMAQSKSHDDCARTKIARARHGKLAAPSASLPGLRIVFSSILALWLAFAHAQAQPAEAPLPYAPSSKSADPSQDIFIEGLGFSKLILDLQAEGNVRGVRFGVIRRNLERNLCWSGLFHLHGGLSRHCRLKRSPARLDLRLRMHEKEDALELELYDLGPEGLRLFNGRIAATQASNPAAEGRIIDQVNALVEAITGTTGLLGSTIAFSMRRPGRLKVIAFTDTHGRSIKNIPPQRQINILPRFSPDGEGIVYTMLGSRGSRLIYYHLHRSRFGHTRTLTEYGSLNIGGTFSPDGAQIVLTMGFQNSADLFGIHISSKRRWQITNRLGIETQADWSPVREELVFVSDRSGTPQVYLMDLNKREDLRLTFESYYNADPRWAPDGERILFTRRVEGVDQIFVMDRYGEDLRQITRGRYNSEQPEWSPDGRQIVFASRRSGEFKLYIVSADGSTLRRLTRTPQDYEENSPTWTARRILR